MNFIKCIARLVLLQVILLIIASYARITISQSSTASYIGEGLCAYSSRVSTPVQHMLCAVESGVWALPAAVSAPPYSKKNCLLDPKGDRCEIARPVPKQEDTPASPPPPPSRNPEYHKFASQAEKLVPKTWWREAFASDSLLLSRNDNELPAKQFSEKKNVDNKKLKNLYQCATRQVFIRKSYSYSEEGEEPPLPSEQPQNIKLSSPDGGKSVCMASHEPAVQTFFKLFTEDPNLGGIYRSHDQSDVHSSESFPITPGRLRKVGWYPSKHHDGKMYMSAYETLQFFYKEVGGIWTGCFKMLKSPYCRGAVASAAMVVSSHLLADIAQSGREGSRESNHRKLAGLGGTLVQGYMLASLGRGMLHGNTDNVGDVPSTPWGVKMVDFVALQQAFLKLYIDSFGKAYTAQLEAHVPMAFPPGVDIYTKRAWAHLPTTSLGPHYLEPVYSSLRNWMYTESGNLIDFGPYRPLVSVPEVTAALLADKRRRILVDVGANGFFASPKYLLDSYAPYLPFTDAIMIEPEPHFSASIPRAYSERYTITQHKIYAEVNTGTENDILKILQKLVTPQDFVVLKFDVDPNKHAQGATMEWGFLFDLAMNPVVAELVDELYIELHFHFPSLYWTHLHSNWEALDAIRFLRSKGAVVHAWP